jgi:hypothetical protein
MWKPYSGQANEVHRIRAQKYHHWAVKKKKISAADSGLLKSRQMPAKITLTRLRTTFIEFLVTEMC